jgi:hypothetical protein
MASRGNTCSETGSEAAVIGGVGINSCKMFNRVDWVDFGQIYFQL